MANNIGESDTSQGNDAAQQPVMVEKASGYAWYGLGILVIVYVLNFVDRSILAILAEDIKTDLDLSDSDIGLLYGTAFGVFYALFGIPLGKLADSWHRIRLITIGLAVWSAFTALSGFAKNFAILAFARVGVGIGEATASPSAYSLISDWFPKKMRATALAIYSSGIYIGGGFSLFIGGKIAIWWNEAYPGGGPMGLVGWQAAFISVGLPGLVLSIWVFTLKEPRRGQADGIIQPPVKDPFKGFFKELMAVIPPFTIFGAAQQGSQILTRNLLGLAVTIIIAMAMIWLTGDMVQWIAIGIGYYAIYSWALTLKKNDPPSFALIWGNPAFLCTILGYGTIAFMSYAVTVWAPPYAVRELGQPLDQVGLWIGGPGALGGFLGITIGGSIADWLKARKPSGRLLVVMFGLLAPVVPLIFAFTTQNIALFYFLNFILSLTASSALGAAAATSQDLVLPRMRGTATATFFLATTLVGLALGPYMAGKVSDLFGENITMGALSLLVAVPIGLGLLIAAYRLVPAAEANVLDRARAAGEAV